MKNTFHFLVATAALVLFAPASPANARSSTCCLASRANVRADSCCDNAIAASPKVRATLDERCKNRCAPRDLASPSQTPGYHPTGFDGITASPRLREHLNDSEQAARPKVPSPN